MTDDAARERHRRRMQRQKEIVDARVAGATLDRGVLVVNTGNGKGKSSAAFGMVARALGHGMKVAVVQFIKGSQSTGEETFFRRFPELQYHVMGEGFTWETQDPDLDRRAALAAWGQAAVFLADPAFQLVVLDELNIALKLGLLPLDRVLEALDGRPAHQHVVVTGRGAPPALIEIADTVTEMRPIKHAFDAGVMAQKGIELNPAAAVARTLVLGGVRSGKSRFAEGLARADALPVTYVATARAGDGEMARRIAEHQRRRPAAWRLVEEPLALAEALAAAAAPGRCILVECLTLWITNLLLDETQARIEREFETLLGVVERIPGRVILVGNETNMGVTPLGELSRRYCDLAGGLHQALAERCDRVILVVAGLPLVLKGAVG